MSTRMFCSLFILLIGSSQLFAQATGPHMYLPSNEPDMKKLLADRELFVTTYYAPDAATFAKIQKNLADIAPFQEKYQKDTALTLQRLSLAMGIVSEPGTSDAEREARLNSFTKQAGAIHSRAPLSLANVAKIVEPMLPPDKVAAARAKISGELSSKLQGQPLDITRIDYYLIAPPAATPKPIITRPVPTDDRAAYSNQQPVPVPNTATPQKPAETKKTPTQMPPLTKPTPPTPAAKAAPTPTPLPPPPPKVVKKAPPKTDWSKDIDTAKKKYNYSPDQLKVMDIIVTSVMTRADKPSMEKDVSGNMPIDVLYDELVQRLDSLASIEQRQKANPTPPAAPAAAPTPAAAKPAAGGH